MNQTTIIHSFFLMICAEFLDSDVLQKKRKTGSVYFVDLSKKENENEEDVSLTGL